MWARFLLAGIGSVMLSACSDPNKASDENFRKAIDAALSKRPMCIDVPMETLKPAGDPGQSTFPIYVAMPAASTPQDQFGIRIKPLDALTTAGLLDKREGAIKVSEMWAGSDKTIPVKIYDLTEKGKQSLDTPGTRPRDFLASGRDRFCYGTREVAAIKEFTQPADAMGMRVSRVTYTWRLKNPADWVALPSMVEAFPQLRSAVGADNEASNDLVLTNNGWVDARGSR